MALRTVDYEDILKGTAELCGLDPTNISDLDFATLRRSHRKRLRTAYEYHLWPELIRTEQRYFRGVYTPGTTYAVPTTTTVDEVYNPDTDKYYQALRAMPLAVTSITRSSTTATVTTTADHQLITGDQVSITGAVETAYNITATITKTGATTFTYEVANSPSSPATGTPKVNPNPANSSGTLMGHSWGAAAKSYSNADYAAATAYVVGDIVYYPTTDRYYQCIKDSTGNVPTTAANWSVLTPFDPYVAYAQSGKTAFDDVFSVTDANPRLTTRWTELNWFRSENGVQIESNTTKPVLTYRTRAPYLKGDPYNSLAAYVSGDQVYYSSSTVAGNFYDCILASTGNLPTNATYFTAVSIPLIFDRYLEQGGYADWLKSQKRNAEAAAEDLIAAKLLDDQKSLLVSQQGLNERTRVLTR